MATKRQRPARLIRLVLVTLASIGMLVSSPSAGPADGLAPFAGRAFSPRVKPNWRLGQMVVADGDRVAALAPRLGEPGAVVVMDRIAGLWRERAVLTTLGISDWASASIDLSDDTVVVGLPHRADGVAGSGAVVVFRETPTGWVQVAELTAPAPEESANFGTSVALEGDRLVVGESSRDHGALDAGSAWLFDRTGDRWGAPAQLVSAEPGTANHFGSNVAIEKDRIAVGAPERDGDHVDEGAMYVFERLDAGWAQTAVLVANETVGGDALGSQLAMDGGRIAATLRKRLPLGGMDVFEVVVFAQSGERWTQEARIDTGKILTGESTQPIDLSGDRLAVGVLYGSAIGYAAVRVFDRGPTGWSEIGVLRPTFGRASDEWCGCMGSGVALAGADGELVVAGAPGDSTSGYAAGLLWEFELRAPPAGVSIGDVAVAESTPRGSWIPASFPLTIANPQPVDVTVSYTTHSGTATEGEDFDEVNGDVTIPAGALGTTVTVWIKGDGFFEGPGAYARAGFERFTVELNRATGVSLGRRVGVGTIHDARTGFWMGDVGVVEPDDRNAALGWVTVSLERPAAGPVEIDYQTNPNRSATTPDFLTRSGTATIPAGSTYARIPVWVRGDEIAESEETFALQITDARGITCPCLGRSEALISILADE